MTWTWLRKINLIRDIDPLLIAVKNSTLITNYFKTKTDYSQQNSKCRFCRKRDETNSHKLSDDKKYLRTNTKLGTTGWKK